MSIKKDIEKFVQSKKAVTVEQIMDTFNLSKNQVLHHIRRSYLLEKEKYSALVQYGEKIPDNWGKIIFENESPDKGNIKDCLFFFVCCYGYIPSRIEFNNTFNLQASVETYKSTKKMVVEFFAEFPQYRGILE